MKIIFGALLLIALVGMSLAAAAEGGRLTLLNGVEHFKQSTVRIEGSKVIYFDPFSVSGEPHDGDLVFISHTHGDHLSVPDLKKIGKADT